jgi:uncharacterized protein (TIGR02147 family)
MSILQYDDYRLYLKNILQEKTAANPLFSQRAFAKFLGISHVALSNVLAGKRSFSSELALKVAKKLKFTETEKRRLLLLVQIAATKDLDIRQELERQLHATRPVLMTEIAQDSYQRLNKWYHFPVSAMTELENFSAKEASKRLGITLAEAQGAIDDLLSTGVLSLDAHGNYKQEKRYLVTGKNSLDDVLEKYKIMADKAHVAFKTQPPSTRFGNTETFSFSQKNVEKARALTEEYLAQMNALAGTHNPVTPPTDIYHLVVYFFNLTP